MTQLTILTPTFERKNELKKLYLSLCGQTNKQFKWLVVDDGSTDDTCALAEEFRSLGVISVDYIRKKNGGKHTALNVGIARIETELTFIVDSDDILTEDAVDIILSYHKKYKTIDNLCGYSFLRGYPDKTINGKRFYPDEWIESYTNARINTHDIKADKAEVFYTKCLKKYPFPEYKDEKFLGEDIVWIRMARNYKMVHINQMIYIANYREDGLTKNRRKHNLTSPIGCMNRAREFMGKELKCRYRIRGGVQYIVYGRFAGYSVCRLLKESTYKALTIVCLFPGIIVYKYWNLKEIQGRKQ